MARCSWRAATVPATRDSAELYDPETGAWTAIANMRPTGNRFETSTATLLQNGKVLVLGSHFNGPVSGELYDPATGAWTAIGDMPARRARARCCRMAWSLVSDSGSGLAELYDPGTRVLDDHRDHARIA